MADKSEYIGFKVTPEMKEQFKNAAKERGQLMTWVLVKAIEDYIALSVAVKPKRSKAAKLS